MPIAKPVAFATAAENIAGTAENKAIDPLGIREALNCTGDAPVYACRAWVNFNGTGTVAIRASGNVSSVTDNGTGNYTVNFTTAMIDANYAVVASPGGQAGTNMIAVSASASPTSSACQISTMGGSGSQEDKSYITASFFR